MSISKWVRGSSLAAATAVLVLAVSEGGLRLVLRLRDGAWPRTRAVELDERLALLRGLYRPHPYLNAGPRPGGVAAAFGKSAALNLQGYRSPARPERKAPGALRVLVSGGSAAFDVLAPDDASTWPWLLEGRLRSAGLPAEVWNAGFPGWTSQENVISLAIRDLDLSPDVAVLFQGLNDLQPGSHRPFDPQYEAGHAELARRSLGLEAPPPSLLDRSLLLERLRDLSGGPRNPWRAISHGGAEGARWRRITPGAVAAFERNVRSYAALARSRGAVVLLVTQPVRIRAAQREEDVDWLSGWYPELDPGCVPAEAERLNRVLRRLSREGVGVLADAAREVPWDDADFGDPLHLVEPGRRKLVEYLAPRVAGALGKNTDRHGPARTATDKP